MEKKERQRWKGALRLAHFREPFTITEVFWDESDTPPPEQSSPPQQYARLVAFYSSAIVSSSALPATDTCDFASVKYIMLQNSQHLAFINDYCIPKEISREISSDSVNFYGHTNMLPDLFFLSITVKKNR